MAFDLYLQGAFDLALTGDSDGDARPTRRVQAVIAYLALAQGRPVRRDTLAALLWGDRSDAQARQSVRQALSQIRKALGPSHAGALITDDDAVRLDLDQVRTDAAAIEATASHPSADQAKAALESFRGELLATIGPVTGPFDDWLDEARRRQLTLLTAAAAQLAETDRGALQAAGVATALEQLGELDPTSERLARIDAQRLSDAGQQALAQARLETLHRHLIQEGLEPSERPETLAKEATSIAMPPRQATADVDVDLQRFRRWRWLRVALVVVVVLAGVWWLQPQGSALAPALAVGEFQPLDQSAQTAELALALSQSLPPAVSMIGGIAQGDAASSRYVLDGTLERMGDDAYRVFAQLEDRESKRVLFTRVFEGGEGNVRGQVLRKLVVATDVAIGEGEQGRFEGTQDLEAWLLASAAIERMRTLTSRGLADARALYADALERDPAFVHASSGLALSYLFDVFVGEALDRARVEALIDGVDADSPVWPTVLVIQAFLALAEGDHDSALDFSATARALQPNGAEISAMRGLMLLQGGELEAGVSYLDRAIALQREAPPWVYWIKARGQRLAGDAPAALALLTGATPSDEPAPLYLSELLLTHAALGDEAEARAVATQLRRQLPEFDPQQWVAILPHRERDVAAAELAALARFAE